MPAGNKLPGGGSLILGEGRARWLRRTWGCRKLYPRKILKEIFEIKKERSSH
jgi:hypothetical protein